MTHLLRAFFDAGIKTNVHLAGMAAWPQETLVNFLTAKDGGNKSIASTRLEVESLKLRFAEYLKGREQSVSVIT